MTRVMKRVVATLGVLCLTAGMALAQTTTASSETKAFEVLAVDGNLLLVNLPEGTREINVPAVSVHGQRTAAVRAAVEAGHERHGRHHDENNGDTGHSHPGEERHGHAVERHFHHREDRRQVKMFTQGDIDKRGVKIMRDGRPPDFGFRQGDQLTATIITSMPPHVMTEKEVQATLAKTKAGRAGGDQWGSRNEDAVVTVGGADPVRSPLDWCGTGAAEDRQLVASSRARERPVARSGMRTEFRPPLRSLTGSRSRAALVFCGRGLINLSFRLKPTRAR